MLLWAFDHCEAHQTVFIMMIEWSLFGFVPPCGFTKALSSFPLFENFVDIFQIQGTASLLQISIFQFGQEARESSKSKQVYLCGCQNSLLSSV